MAFGTLLLWVLALVGPGVALLRLLDGRRAWGETVAVATPVGLGALYLVGLVATRLGLPAVRATLVVAALLVVAWLAVESWRRWRAAPVVRVAPPAQERTSPLAWLLLTAAVVLGVALWWQAHAPLSTPPGWDAMHHGYFVRQIADHQTLSGRVVLSSDPGAADAETSFYPLAVNLVAAALHDVSGVRISTVLLASDPAVAGIVLPVSTFFLCRRLAPRAPLAAGFAAVAAVVPANLFTIEYTGRLTAVAGLALVPAAVLALVSSWRRVGPRSFLVAALAIVGVAGVHTSEVFVAVGTGVLAVLPLAVADRAWRSYAAWLALCGAAGVASVVALIAAEPGIRGLVTERSAAIGTPSPHGVLEILQETFLQPQQFLTEPYSWAMPAWMLLAWLGCLTLLRPSLRPLAGVAASFVGLGAFYALWRSGHPGPLVHLGPVWYSDPIRMQWTFLPLGALLVGCLLATVAEGAAAVARRLTARVGRRPSRHALPGRDGATATLTIGVLVAAVLTLGAPAPAIGRFLDRTGSPVDADYRQAFAYVVAHADPGDRLLDDLRSRGEMWGYVDDGVPVLFGNAPLLGRAPVSWREKLYLRAGLRSLDVDGCVGELMRRFHVRYVVVGPRLMQDARPRIVKRELTNRPDVFRRVYQSGEVRVFEVTPPPAQPCLQPDVDTRYPWSGTANAN